MLILMKKGLYCPAGNFYIDPSGGVDHAVVTHAHSDHARRGSKQYYCAESGRGLLHGRLGKSIAVKTYKFGERFQLNNVTISLHPAGHILGSSQVRLEFADGEVWVVSGDYKREHDPTCEPFENVECDVFVTECTFGTPAYQWPKDRNVAQDIYKWWSANAKNKINSVLFGYSLGKTQRLLGVLEPYNITPIYCHPAAMPLNECYIEQGIKLAPHTCLSTLNDEVEGALFIAPSAFLKTQKAELILGENYKTAFASGWMAKGSWGYDAGFLMSDHADWNDLLQTIKESKAKRVYVQHRGNGALVKHLRGLGLKAYPDTDLVPREPNQMALF